MTVSPTPEAHGRKLPKICLDLLRSAPTDGGPRFLHVRGGSEPPPPRRWCHIEQMWPQKQTERRCLEWSGSLEPAEWLSGCPRTTPMHKPTKKLSEPQSRTGSPVLRGFKIVMTACKDLATRAYVFGGGDDHGCKAVPMLWALPEHPDRKW